MILISKDVEVDMKNKFVVLGILLFSVALSYIASLTLSQLDSNEIGNGVFWLIVLFVSVISLTKSFMIEKDRSLYLYIMTKAQTVIMAKLIYNFVFLTFIIFISYISLR